MKTVIIFFLVSICGITHAMPQEFIHSINIEQNKVTYYVDKEFHTTYLRDNLYVAYADDIDLAQLDYTIITMPLIMNTISMIWVSGKKYTIQAMDKDLYASLKTVREIFKRFYPATSFEGDLIPTQLIDNSTLKTVPHSDSTALPFSHGLDSLCTSLRLRDTQQLLITARGYPDTPLDYWNKNWEYTQNLITHFAHMHGHRATFINSNFHEFFNWAVLCNITPEINNWRICLVEGLGWMGLAAPILVSKGYNTFVLPANNDWNTPHPGADSPLIVETVTFAGITNICEGFELNRVEKNNIIVNMCNEYGLEKPPLVICEKILKDRKNCCKCLKCVLSILSCILLDENPGEYGFDVVIPDFFDYFKTTFINKYTFEDYSADWFKYCQKEADVKLHTLNCATQQFFMWYNSIDFDALTEPSAQIVLDYNDFTDLYDKIPQEALQRTKKGA